MVRVDFRSIRSPGDELSRGPVVRDELSKFLASANSEKNSKRKKGCLNMLSPGDKTSPKLLAMVG